MKQKVVIIGVSYSSRLALARAIGANGYEITVVVWSTSSNNPKPIDANSKYVNRVLFCPKQEDAFIRLLKEKCRDENKKVILLPDCDFSVAMIDLHQNELMDSFLMPHICYQLGSIVDWSNKLKQKQLAKRIGLKVAESVIIDIREGSFVIPSNIKYPCFPKALVSVSGGKAGMFRCNNIRDLEKAMKEIIERKESVRVMVEDFKSIDHEYAVLGFSDGQSVSIPAVIQFIQGSKTQKGIALQGKVMPIDGFESIVEKFKEFIRQIGYFGLFDIDFYESSGDFYFSELNLRYGGSGYAVVKMGVNLPSMFVEKVLGNEVRDSNRLIDSDSIFFNERMGYNDLINGYISTNEYFHYVRSSNIFFIKDNDDYEPYKAYAKTLRTAFLKCWAKKTLRWIKK